MFLSKDVFQRGTASNASLISLLQQKIQGEVRFDEGSRAIYSTDASNYRQIPIGVVIPKNKQDIIQTLKICREMKVPILARGGGTSLAGQCCNVAVVIDTSKYFNRILEIDSVKKIARVEPGVVLDTLREAVKPHGLTFGPDPATHNRCTLGGMIGNNACGVHSVMAGKTVDNIESLEILTVDGEIMKVGRTSEKEFQAILQAGGRRAEILKNLKQLVDKHADLIRKKFPKIPRRVSGYNLDELLPENEFNVARALVGTEGTCAMILEATVKLIPNPSHRVLLVLGYPDVFQAADDMGPILAHKPIGVEGLDEYFIRNMKIKGMHLPEIAMLPEGKGWLLVEFGAWSESEAKASAEKLMQELKKRSRPPAMKLYTDAQEQKSVWSVRESTFGATVFVPGHKDTFAGFEDPAVPPEKLGPFLRDLEKLLKKFEYEAVIYGHFGDGCIHSRMSFDFKTEAGIKKYREFLEEASDLVLHYGGSLSGEHGDGQNWGELLHKMFGAELVEAFKQFKKIWDPENLMNPGKVVNTYKSDENLRFVPAKIKQHPVMNFQFPEDGGDFGRTSERCIGIGKCRKTDEGIMCPSYMVTLEEEHSTRGRARLLFEMMRGEVITDGWKNESVKESLDLCLACKGCKSECPVNVDMATYKSEFLSHYYEGKLRPRTAYAMGLIYWWAKIGSALPWLTNFLTQAPGLSAISKWMAGISFKRQIPKFAPATFRDWFWKRKAKMNPGQKQVILWADTFYNHFYPEILKSAVNVFEALGYEVFVPEQSLCCGRPLYDFGMLKLAKWHLKQIVDTLQPLIEAGVPLVGLEPGCLSVFRDELPNLFPNHPMAKRLARQTYLLSEFLEKEKPDFVWPKLNRDVLEAIVQGHCHHKSVFGMEAEKNLLKKVGLDVQILDSGCCGMAGVFGFEAKHYEISKQIADRVLTPQIKMAAAETLVIANGFSCREQIQQLTGREPYHLVQILESALTARKLPQHQKISI